MKSLYLSVVMLASVCGHSQSVFDVRHFGATGDGSSNDLHALQATVVAADAAGGGTVYLYAGTYNIGSGEWKVGSANSQHYINIVGDGPNVSVVLSVNPSGNAIYLQQEKYTKLEGFSVIQGGAPQTGNGISLGGDGDAGTQTNGLVVEDVGVSGFRWCVNSSGGIGTSSEITFIGLNLNHCTDGFHNSNFNGLNFTFVNLQISDNVVGVNAQTPGVNVFGGAAAVNGDDFILSNNGQNIISGFRSESPANTFVTLNAGNLTILDAQVEGLSTPASHTAVFFAGNHLTIMDSQIGGQVSVQAGSTLADERQLTLINNTIFDTNNTYSLTSQPVGQGPGFRFVTGSSSGGRFVSLDNYQGDSSVNGARQWPSGEGYILSPQGSSQTEAFMSGMSIGAPLAIVNNTIQPTAYIHHVGAGLIKTIDATGGVAGLNGNPLPLSCVQLIPDCAFTTDTTGNIAKGSTAAVGQVMTVCYDPAIGKWFPSY